LHWFPPSIRKLKNFKKVKRCWRLTQLAEEAIGFFEVRKAGTKRRKGKEPRKQSEIDWVWRKRGAYPGPRWKSGKGVGGSRLPGGTLCRLGGVLGGSKVTKEDHELKKAKLNLTEKFLEKRSGCMGKGED